MIIVIISRIIVIGEFLLSHSPNLAIVYLADSYIHGGSIATAIAI